MQITEYRGKVLVLISVLVLMNQEKGLPSIYLLRAHFVYKLLLSFSTRGFRVFYLASGRRRFQILVSTSLFYIPHYLMAGQTVTLPC